MIQMGLLFNFKNNFLKRLFLGFSKTVGSISNDFEKITTDDKGHMSAKFSNSVSLVFVVFNLSLSRCVAYSPILHDCPVIY